MSQTRIALIAAVALIGSIAATAAEHEHAGHHTHMPATTSDTRQLVDFPPEMRQHTLANMRDHLQALSEILTAISGAQYGRAARIAETRLGMDSPSAEGCREEVAGAAAPMSKPAGMDRQMADFMPEGMRLVGLEMHKSASVFAAEANKVGRTGNAKPVLAALSRVTQQCAACHAAYKMQ